MKRRVWLTVAVLGFRYHSPILTPCAPTSTLMGANSAAAPVLNFREQRARWLARCYYCLGLPQPFCRRQSEDRQPRPQENQVAGFRHRRGRRTATAARRGRQCEGRLDGTCDDVEELSTSRRRNFQADRTGACEAEAADSIADFIQRRSVIVSAVRERGGKAVACQVKETVVGGTRSCGDGSPIHGWIHRDRK